jgi:hypothetical protein
MKKKRSQHEMSHTSISDWRGTVISEKACKEVFSRGDAAIKTTFLACFSNGGFTIFDQFALADRPPQTVDELSALMTNSSLSDGLFRQCFEKTELFEHLNEHEHETVLIAAADNPRLMTPYDDTFLDGWSDYSYHSVFGAAWKLAFRRLLRARRKRPRCCRAAEKRYERASM